MTTTVDEQVWREQAKAFLTMHGDDLTAIAAAANDFGVALEAKDANATVAAISDFLAKVGKTEVDLPPNAFGHDLLDVMNHYVIALSTVRTGVLTNDQKKITVGSDALSVAVAKFSVITARVKSSS